MTRLNPCPQCQRHVRTSEVCCPFCAKALPSGLGAGRETTSAPTGVKRAKLFASSERSNRASVLLGGVLGASLVAAACGSDDESTGDVMQQQGGEQSGPTSPETEEPPSDGASPSNPAVAPETSGSLAGGSGPAPNAPASNSVAPEVTSPEGTAMGPSAPGTNTAPRDGAGPHPDATAPADDRGPGDEGTPVPIYGAVIPPFDDEMEEGDSGVGGAGGAAGAGGMANTEPDAGASDAGASMGGMENEPPQVQPLYGAPAFSEE